MLVSRQSYFICILTTAFAVKVFHSFAFAQPDGGGGTVAPLDQAKSVAEAGGGVACVTPYSQDPAPRTEREGEGNEHAPRRQMASDDQGTGATAGE